MRTPSKSKAVKVKTPDGVVADDLPERMPVVAEEIALLRAFLAQEIDEILWPTAAGLAQTSNKSLSADNQPTNHSLAAVATDGSAAGEQSCR